MLGDAGVTSARQRCRCAVRRLRAEDRRCRGPPRRAFRRRAGAWPGARRGGSSSRGPSPRRARASGAAARRPDQDEGRAGRRERLPAPAARGPRPPGQAARAHPRRPPPPRPPGAPGPRLARRAAHRAAGDAAALAPAGLPAASGARRSRGASKRPQVSGGDGRADPAHGGGEPAVGRRADPRGTAEARHPGGQAHGPAPPARGAPAAARGGGQTWATFLRNHADETWACDFLPVVDLGFRPLFAFFVVELGSRRVVHVGVTRHPTDAWVAQQLREATPFDAAPALPHPRQRPQVRAARSPASRPRAGSACCARPSGHRGRTRPASASSGACGASAWTTSSSWARRTCGACSGSTSRTSTRRGRTRGSGRPSPAPRAPAPPVTSGRAHRVPPGAGWTAPRLSPGGVTALCRRHNATDGDGSQHSPRGRDRSSRQSSWVRAPGSDCRRWLCRQARPPPRLTIRRSAPHTAPAPTRPPPHPARATARRPRPPASPGGARAARRGARGVRARRRGGRPPSARSFPRWSRGARRSTSWLTTSRPRNQRSVSPG